MDFLLPLYLSSIRPKACEPCIRDRTHVPLPWRVVRWEEIDGAHACACDAVPRNQVRSVVLRSRRVPLSEFLFNSQYESYLISVKTRSMYSRRSIPL